MYRLLHFDEIDSTNAYALRNIDTLEDGDIITALGQTSGRGRLGRKWFAGGADNVCMSIVLKPEKNHALLPLANITKYMSVIISKTAEMYGINCSIKWPNDILINSKKAAGILSEASFSGVRMRGLVLGTGININSSPEYSEILSHAESFSNVCGKKIDRNLFVFRIIEKFFGEYGIFLEKGFSYIRDEYLKRFVFIDKEITIASPDGMRAGKAVDITDDGFIVLESENGVSVVTAGDILQ